jgi:hypothetical protein
MDGGRKRRAERQAAAAVRLKRSDRALASAERRIAMARALIAESKVTLAAIRGSQGQHGAEA